MVHNTTKATKATTNTNKAVSINNRPVIDKAGAVTIAAALLRQYKSRQAIKAQGATLRAKYGADNWKLIDTAIKEQRQGEIETEAAAARAGVRALSPALDFAFKQARKGGHFGALEKLALEKYGTPAAFIAACYSNVIDGAPAVRVSYVSGDGRTIVDAFQKAEIDGRKAAAIIDTCIGNFGRALKAANNGGKAYKAPARAQQAGVIVAAYNAIDGDVMGTICKGAPVTDDKALQAYKAGNVAALVTLSAFNAQGRKAAALAKAAALQAVIDGQAAPAQDKVKQAVKGAAHRAARANKAQADKARAEMARIDAEIKAGQAEIKAGQAAALVTA